MDSTRSATRPLQLCLAVALVVLSPVATAHARSRDASPQQDHVDAVGGEGGNETSRRDGIVEREDGVVVYEPGFYERYNPVTALDMVSRTPGFSINGGGDSRGFGQSSGNVLIGGERPSSKSDSVRDILSRIPAGQVERIELIRGSTGGLDVAGQSVVANVVLGQRTGSGFVEIGGGYEAGQVAFRGEIAYDGQVGAVDYLASVSRFAANSRSTGTESLVRPDGGGERREEIDHGRFSQVTWNLRAESRLSDRDVVRFSGQFRTNPGGGDEVSNRFTLGSDVPDVVRQISDRTSESFELGGDHERVLSASGRLKTIGLVRRTFRDSESRLDTALASGETDARRSLSDSSSGEDIGRVELDWRAGGHQLQASGEVARNFVESDFQLFETEGGVLVEVDLEGSNTRVSELRSEWWITDSWAASPRWTIDTGVGFQVSTISQTGDVDNDRTFRYLQPSLALTFSPTRADQLRVRFEREIAQLDFFDFVSSADFEDDDLAFGNPELEPERTWAVEAAYEKRFGEIGVTTLRVFHDWIQEVQDLLPLGETFEVPGNIGDGRRWGVDVDATVGLDALGLDYAQIDLGGYWQDSSVTDPVTGEPRPLSGERTHSWRVGYRQESPRLALSWGASYRQGSARVFYGLDELDLRDDAGNLQAFAEKIVLDGVKVRLRAENLLDGESIRDRSVFEGPRTLGALRFRELRRRAQGRELSLTLSRTF